MIKITAREVSRPLNQVFTIARGSKTEAVSVRVELEMDGYLGRGEAIPYARYGETPAKSLEAIALVENLTLDQDIRAIMPAGSARNALDCALWDLRAKISGRSVADLNHLDQATQVRTAQTLSLDTPEKMGLAAAQLSQNALIKVKLGGGEDIECLEAIRSARPDAQLIVDANEGWSKADYLAMILALQSLDVKMIEQPFPSENDEMLMELERPIPICADESVHTSEGLERLAKRYDMINIKLDKSGGLTEAIAMMGKSSALKMPYMIGCMVGSSLAMAPAFLLAKNAQYVDLDGPLFLREDEQPKIQYRDGIMMRPSPDLWG